MSSTVHISPLAYLSALLRALLLCTIAFIVYIALLEYRRGVSTDHFRRAIHSGELAKASSYLALAHQEPAAGWLLNFSSGRATAVALLYSLLRLLAEQQPERALETADELPWEDLGIHDRSAIADIQHGLSELGAVIQKRNSLEARLRQHAEIKKRLRSQYDILVTEFGQLVGLAPSPYIDEANRNFYLSGVLEGLPKLQGLPDGIKDQAEFKAALTQLGGKVWMKGNAATLAFRDGLESIRSASSKVEQEEREMYELESSAEGSFKIMAADIQDRSAKVKEDVTTLLLRTEPVSLRELISSNILKS